MSILLSSMLQMFIGWLLLRFPHTLSSMGQVICHWGSLVSLLAIMVKVCSAKQSPPTRWRSLGPFVVKVSCTRQSPLTKGRSLRPIVVKVCCIRQSHPTRGRSLQTIVIEVHCTRQSSPTRGRFLRPTSAESAARDKVPHWGADIWDLLVKFCLDK